MLPSVAATGFAPLAWAHRFTLSFQTLYAAARDGNSEPDACAALYLLIHLQGQSVLPDPTELKKTLSEGNSEVLAFIPIYLEL